MKKLTFLTFFCALLAVPLLYGQSTLSTTAEGFVNSTNTSTSSQNNNTFQEPIVTRSQEDNNPMELMAISRIDGPYCDPCSTPGSGFALACGTGSNSIIQGIDVSGLANAVNILSVDYMQDSQGSNPGSVTVNIFCGSAAANPPPYSGSDVPDYSENFPVNGANDGSCVTLNFTMPYTVDASCDTVWIEFLTTTGRLIHTPQTCGGNPGTGLNSWIQAPDCGINVPTLFSTLGFPSEDAAFSITVEDAAAAPFTECGVPLGQPIPAVGTSGPMTPSVATV
ncbi:MAG: hypothetical protein COB12_13055, partial [Flavobacterium sp.]